MSRDPRVDWTDPKGFPRVSGDEPDSVANIWSSVKFSPRERG